MVLLTLWAPYDWYASRVAATVGIPLNAVVLGFSIFASTKTRALWFQARNDAHRDNQAKQDWFRMVAPEDRPKVLDERGAAVGDTGAPRLDRGYDGV